jgi:thioredoxin reductase (NADPH)
MALVLADLRLPDMSGIDLMAKVHGLAPGAKRALLTGWGDLEVGDRLVRAAVLGQVDDWGRKSWQPGDEGFHKLVVGLLHEWAQAHRPGFEAVQVVGEQWSARSHELRDVLARNKVRYGFLPATSEEGRALLDRLGATTNQLPVVVTFDGLVLRNPSFAEVAEALSAPTRPTAAAYNVVMLGAGPAGLAAAVYGASEGLTTVVVEPEATGGQAGTSAIIRNYLGFPEASAAPNSPTGPSTRPSGWAPTSSTASARWTCALPGPTGWSPWATGPRSPAGPWSWPPG